MRPRTTSWTARISYQARPGPLWPTAWREIPPTLETVQSTPDGLAQSVEGGQPQAVHDRLQKGIEFSTARTDGRRRHLLAPADRHRVQRPDGYAASTTMDIKNLKKVDKYTVQLRSEPTRRSRRPARGCTVAIGLVDARGLQRRPVHPDRHPAPTSSSFHPSPRHSTIRRSASRTSTHNNHGLLRRDRPGPTACSVVRSTQ